MFDKLMPKGMEPLNIFKTKAKHPVLFNQQMTLGGILLYKGELDRVERELILHRTCARCGSKYEWGVHVNAFARPLKISEEKIAGTLTAAWDDPVWSERESTLIRMTDELHDTNTVSDECWAPLSEGWTEKKIIEMIAIVGNYHGIAYITNALRIDLEPNAESELWDQTFSSQSSTGGQADGA
jgi:alkylhydroperoxidase family enzyme